MHKKEIDEIRARCETATPLPDYPGYYVTRDGDVISTIPWRGSSIRILDKQPNTYGYLRVRLTTDGKRCSKYIHKLVASEYLPPKPSECDQIRHLDGNKLNNCADNLAWGTAKSNANDREDHGNTAKGERNGWAILNERDVSIIKTMLSYGVPQRKIASLFFVSQRAICHINREETWKHVG